MRHGELESISSSAGASRHHDASHTKVRAGATHGPLPFSVWPGPAVTMQGTFVLEGDKAELSTEKSAISRARSG